MNGVDQHIDTVTEKPEANTGTDARLNVNAVIEGQPIDVAVTQNTYTTTTTTTVNVGTSAEVLAVANPDRKFLSVSINCMTTTECMAVRYYPAATDNDFQGVEVLARNVTGNNSLFNPTHFMQQTNIYTGEVSGVSDAGTVEVYVTEGF